MTSSTTTNATSSPVPASNVTTTSSTATGSLTPTATATTTEALSTAYSVTLLPGTSVEVFSDNLRRSLGLPSTVAIVILDANVSTGRVTVAFAGEGKDSGASRLEALPATQWASELGVSSLGAADGSPLPSAAGSQTSAFSRELIIGLSVGGAILLVAGSAALVVFFRRNRLSGNVAFGAYVTTLAAAEEGTALTETSGTGDEVTSPGTGSLPTNVPRARTAGSVPRDR